MRIEHARALIPIAFDDVVTFSVALALEAAYGFLRELG